MGDIRVKIEVLQQAETRQSHSMGVIQVSGSTPPNGFQVILPPEPPKLKVTKGFTFGMPTPDDMQALYDAYLNALLRAQNQGITKLACPILAGPALGWPPQVEAVIAARAAQSFEKTLGANLEIDFYVDPMDPNREAYQQSLEQVLKAQPLKSPSMNTALSVVSMLETKHQGRYIQSEDFKANESTWQPKQKLNTQERLQKIAERILNSRVVQALKSLGKKINPKPRFKKFILKLHAKVEQKFNTSPMNKVSRKDRIKGQWQAAKDKINNDEADKLKQHLPEVSPPQQPHQNIPEEVKVAIVGLNTNLASKSSELVKESLTIIQKLWLNPSLEQLHDLQTNGSDDQKKLLAEVLDPRLVAPVSQTTLDAPQPIEASENINIDQLMQEEGGLEAFLGIASDEPEKVETFDPVKELERRPITWSRNEQESRSLREERTDKLLEELEQVAKHETSHTKPK